MIGMRENAEGLAAVLVPGWFVLAESALAWSGAVLIRRCRGFDHRPGARPAARSQSAGRVPTLVATGRTLTESAAIILRLAELNPDGGLAPEPGDPLRPAFLNRLMWFVSVLYPTFTYRDYPERWAPDAAEQLAERVDAFRRSLWLQFEAEVGDGAWVLGTHPSALDIYVAAFSRWRPRREWIGAHCPKLHRIALAAMRCRLWPGMRRHFG